MTENEPDMTCVPYAKRRRYYALTAVFLVVLGWVILYLWAVSPFLALIVIGFYLATNYFQAYCCYYQRCPYVGAFCPAISGIYLGNILASHLRKKNAEVSEKKFKLHKNLGVFSWFATVLFPLYWIYQFSLEFALLYFIFQLGHYVIFGLSVCPSCAIRDICPGGSLQRSVSNR
ncbi:MAG: conserved membrane protein of unknown function [Candidatus Thorarchaeota archaeon]|nr:MAG: conserved membrane protein of unknown function [Candidatus Thorarchaeota archaeon]